ncbi:RecF/RecN/SMC N terminal domain, putative [Coleofasciculus chthonoplastes PCC 7420]|uniref:RecF/RecN/SMC N terminal domain, putative n=1 Tax=Coleofasciculus chthonoplastes PCC 7420 TaxID=118168 RepID=B4VNQ6_9CYAN|nr:ATP-binding protein [Coleofasciculus chthonoplastes]EDX76447.1 RecF/RecN/SMC N terminal domain, putative [Coleofasciculus chthonoplastes PCC 7420]
MKVQSVELKYFKKFSNPPVFDFTDSETGLARDIIVLIGMNGAGKTSLLQAIAATLGVATGRLQKLPDLDWVGFNYELLGNNWDRFEPEVTLKVQFSSEELHAVQEFNHKLQEMDRHLPVPPAEDYLATLRWQGERVQADKAAQLFQFKGRDYAKQLLRSEGFQVFERVGTVFWYTEQRTSTSLTSENPDQKIEITENILRDRLSKWRQFHQDVETGRIKQLRPGQKDVYAEIEQAYQKVFPERSFEGPVPRENIDDILSEPWFYLYDGKNQYEISELSGGERAIFPILMDFANWNIHNSVILIDELELHLHPPMQQALLRNLLKLGKNNQFIITTHSDYVEQLVPEAHIIRLEV